MSAIMTSPDNEPGMLRRQADAWWVRLHSGQATRADAQAFRQWATRSKEHAQAWRDVMRTWTALDPLLAEEARRQASRGGAFSLTWPSISGLSQVLHSPGRRAFFGGAVAASVAAGVLMVEPPLGLWPSVGELTADYRTATGEQRQVALGQRVNVSMNTQTLINRKAGSESGGMELVSGEAEIQARGADDFFVEAGGGRIQARTARINVRYTGPQVCVTCIDGRVSVSVAGQQRPLEAGRQLIYDRAGMQDVERADLARVSTWRSGTLSFDQTPLAEVVAEINRYRPGRIILRNEGLARTPVRMQVALRSIDNVPVMIRELYGARLRNLPGGIVLLS
ncbi:FecR family protein [Variovorax sp. GB1P17]|uniref:FecR family protein n=1 Tax=Variovorax sp. GB1P17 TaxID=3443740 RepID=UPI003F49438C